MQTATFYLIEPSSDSFRRKETYPNENERQSVVSELTSPRGDDQLIMDKVIQLCCEFSKNDAKVFILTEQQQQAEGIDESLWKTDMKTFVSHHLIGEGRHPTSAIEIGWRGCFPQDRRQILINLAQEAPNFAPAFRQVIDFVPCDEILKQRARERYQFYRQTGFQMKTTPLDSLSHT